MKKKCLDCCMCALMIVVTICLSGIIVGVTEFLTKSLQ